MNLGKKPIGLLQLLGWVLKAGLAIIGLYFVVGLLMLTPPGAAVMLLFERKRIYTDARQRVEKAGGWQAIETCSQDFGTNVLTEDLTGLLFFHGKRYITNQLPPVFEALRPMHFKKYTDDNGVQIFEIKLSGIHRSGSYAQPYYAIRVMLTNLPDYTPKTGRRFESDRGFLERKGNAIFEAR